MILTIVESKAPPVLSIPTKAAGTAIVCVRGPPALASADLSTLPSVKFGTYSEKKSFGSASFSTQNICSEQTVSAEKSATR
jgi:hypothetical protein